MMVSLCIMFMLGFEIFILYQAFNQKREKEMLLFILAIALTSYLGVGALTPIQHTSRVILPEVRESVIVQTLNTDPTYGVRLMIQCFIVVQLYLYVKKLKEHSDQLCKKTFHKLNDADLIKK